MSRSAPAEAPVPMATDDFGIEQHGVDTIPDAERTARPRDVIGILWGGNLALSVIVFGWLAILYGLSWWQAVSAILVGTFVGSLAVMPMALLGYRAATNNSVSSGAYFGVRGRLVASVIGILLCLGYIALTVWTGGEAVVASLVRMTGTRETDLELAAGYAVIAALVAVVAVYGFRWLVRLNKVIVVVVGATVVLSLIAFAPDFDASYPGTPHQYALGEFWPTWLLAALTAGVAGPISYVTLIGDWTRYISPRRHRPGPLLGATFTGLFVGLDLDAILPRLTRTQATLVVTAIALALVFLGRFVWAAEESVTFYVLLLTSLATPWAVVTMIGYTRTKGRFDQDSLQVFNRRAHGGSYWYWRGWNLDAVAAWAVGSVVGVLSNSTETYSGPIASRVGGVDVSVLTSAVAAGAVYLALIALRPRAQAPRARKGETS